MSKLQDTMKYLEDLLDSVEGDEVRVLYYLIGYCSDNDIFVEDLETAIKFVKGTDYDEN